MDKIGQIPQGQQYGFHLEQNIPWKQNHCSRRAISSDMLAILLPRSRN